MHMVHASDYNEALSAQEQGAYHIAAMHATSRAEHIPPDTAIASSPLLREPITDPRQPIRERPKVTQAESFRLSRDLAKLRWDGTELQEDDLREVDCEDKAYEYQSVTGDFDADMDHRAVDSSQDDLDAASYSTLSKRADFILAHAKRKLNVSLVLRLRLEGYAYKTLAVGRQPWQGETFLVVPALHPGSTNYFEPLKLRVTRGG